MPPFDAELIPNRNTARIIFLRNREHENSIGLQQSVGKIHRSKPFNFDECMRIKKLLNRKTMKTFEEILNTITCNGMRELTNERARQAAMEYASQAIDQCAEQTNLIDDNGDISVMSNLFFDVKKKLK